MSAARVVVKAFAKINLGLRIVGKRPDGYHEIETIFQSVDLFDTVRLEPVEEQKIYVEITSPWALPTGRENLVYRAAELMLPYVEGKTGVRIYLEKRIPVGAGLGGGSSDAAATLVGLNALFELGFDDAQLKALAQELGSDVPYFLIGGLCRGRGRGEVLTRLEPKLRNYQFLLVQPDCSLATEAVYRQYDALVEQGWRPAPPRFFADIDCTNDLEEAAARLCPALRALAHTVAQLHSELWGMSGSGPTYYAGWRSAPPISVNDLAQMGYRALWVRPAERGYELVEGTVMD